MIVGVVVVTGNINHVLKRVLLVTLAVDVPVRLGLIYGSIADRCGV